MSVPNVTNGNGHGEDAEEALRRLLASQSTETPSTGYTIPIDSSPRDAAEDEAKREPNPTIDPDQTVITAGTMEEPKENRQGFVRAGGAASNVPEDLVFGQDGHSGDLGNAGLAQSEVRGDAYAHETSRENDEDLQLNAAVDPDVVAILKSGAADAVEAERTETRAAAIVNEIVATNDEIEIAQQRLDKAEAKVMELRREDPRTAPEPTTPDGKHKEPGRRAPAQGKSSRRGALSLLGKKAMSPKVGIAVGVLDVAVTTFTFQPAVANALDVAPLGAYALAGGLAAGCLGAAAAGGYMLAASRLPTRLVTGLLSVLFFVLLLRFLPAMELLRESSTDKRGLVALTLGTAMASYLAFILGFAHGIWVDSDRDRETAARGDELDRVNHALVIEAGSDLGDALILRTKIRELLESLITRRDGLLEDLKAVAARKESLLDSAERTEVRAAERIGQTARATSRIAERNNRLAVSRRQEHSSFLMAIGLARLLHRKINAEKYPTEARPANPVQTETPTGETGNPNADRYAKTAALVAIAALAIGGALGLLLTSPAVFAAGAVIAAIALIAPTGRLRRSKPTLTSGSTATETDPEAVRATADVTQSEWIRHPESTRAGHTRGDDQNVNTH